MHSAVALGVLALCGCGRTDLERLSPARSLPASSETSAPAEPAPAAGGSSTLPAVPSVPTDMGAVEVTVDASVLSPADGGTMQELPGDTLPACPEGELPCGETCVPAEPGVCGAFRLECPQDGDASATAGTFVQQGTTTLLGLIGKYATRSIAVSPDGGALIGWNGSDDVACVVQFDDETSTFGAPEPITGVPGDVLSALASGPGGLTVAVVAAPVSVSLPPEHVLYQRKQQVWEPLQRFEGQQFISKFALVGDQVLILMQRQLSASGSSGFEMSLFHYDLEAGQALDPILVASTSNRVNFFPAAQATRNGDWFIAWDEGATRQPFAATYHVAEHRLDMPEALAMQGALVDVALDGNDNGFVVWTDADGAIFARRYDVGQGAWQPTTLLDEKHRANLPVVGASAEGNALSAWYTRYGDTGVYASRFRISDGSWTVPQLLGAVPRDAPPAVSVFPDGDALVAWKPSITESPGLALARYDAASDTWRTGESDLALTLRSSDTYYPEVQFTRAKTGLIGWHATLERTPSFAAWAAVTVVSMQ